MYRDICSSFSMTFHTKAMNKLQCSFICCFIPLTHLIQMCKEAEDTSENWSKALKNSLEETKDTEE